MNNSLYGSSAKAKKNVVFAKTTARGQVDGSLMAPQGASNMAMTIGAPHKGGDERTVKFLGEPPATAKSLKDFDFKREKQIADDSASKKSKKYAEIFKDNKDVRYKYEIKPRFVSQAKVSDYGKWAELKDKAGMRKEEVHEPEWRLETRNPRAFSGSALVDQAKTPGERRTSKLDAEVTGASAPHHERGVSSAASHTEKRLQSAVSGKS
jgi:hypothetical protein